MLEADEGGFRAGSSTRVLPQGFDRESANASVCGESGCVVNSRGEGATSGSDIDVMQE